MENINLEGCGHILKEARRIEESVKTDNMCKMEGYSPIYW